METFYQTTLTYIHSHSNLKKIIIILARYAPIITFIVYPSLIIYLFFANSPLLLETILRPLSAFILVTLIRKIINRKRPYETMDIIPLSKHKQGESFPSRHTVSAFTIAFACLNVNVTLGGFMIILAIIIACTRILCGVHYLSDVISAIVIALIIALIKI